MSIKAILFDFDGVLTTDKTGLLTTCRYLNKITGIDYSVISSAYKYFIKDLLHGKTTHADIWDSFCDRIGIRIDFNNLTESFSNTPLNTIMFELVHSLKSNGFLVGIITDNMKDRIDFLRKLHNFDDLFDCIVVSAEIGSDKSDEAIFKIAINKLGIFEKDCLFIHNNMDNLSIPKKLGMNTFYHDETINDINILINQLSLLGFKMILV